jgi:phospholipase/lecithinase/hemolysin
MFSRILQALCALLAVALLSGCGGASSTVKPLVPTRVIAFGDGFNYVNDNGAGLSTVQTGETDITIASRIAARFGIVVKKVTVGNPLTATGGFSYANARARVNDVVGYDGVATQINLFLASPAGVLGKNDLIIISVGNWDIKAAIASGTPTADIDTATTNLVTAIQRLTNAGAEHVVVMPSTNMSRTPWATTYIGAHAGVTRATIQNLSNTAATSFNFTLSNKLASAYTQDRKPVILLDRTSDFNSFAGSVDVNGTAVANYSGINLTNLSTAVCTTSINADGCTTAVGAGGLITATDYLTSVFADEINLTPVMNRFLADRMILSLVSFGWIP